MTNIYNLGQTSPQQLIILGNGFDLACGLKSSYSDFFQERFSEIIGSSKKVNINSVKQYYQDHIENKCFNDILNQKVTFWDMIFIVEYCNKKLNDNSEWNNIESTIHKVLHYLATEDNNVNLSETSKKILIQYKKYDRNYSDIIYKELIKFEKCFAKYIYRQVIHNDNYLDIQVPEKLSKLIDNSIIDSESKKLNILSFNYTLTKKTIKNHTIAIVSDSNHSFLLQRNEHDTSVRFSTPLINIVENWINIHGEVNSINNPIIFGIDSSMVNNMDHDSLEYKLEIKFTKTFRVAINNSLHSISPLPHNIDLITFYGHSLSSADFSYFESIFDMYNLYSSQLKLEFFYGAYDLYEEEKSHNDIDESKLKTYISNQNDSIKQNLMTNVYNLLNDYGSSLSNNHGENLLHRLLLEGRISFKEDTGSFKLTEKQIEDITGNNSK